MRTVYQRASWGDLNDVAQVSLSWAMVEPVTSVGGMVNSAPARFDALVVALDIVGEEHDRGLACWKIACW